GCRRPAELVAGRAADRVRAAEQHRDRCERRHRPHTIAATLSSPRDSPVGLEWSPDGQSLLYRCQHDTIGTAFGVCLADPDGQRPPRSVWQSVAARVLGASFSPDGRSIAVMADSGLDVIDSTTGRVRWNIPLSSRFYYTPVWSPNGSQIAFTGYLG